jgi:hypothetical protein
MEWIPFPENQNWWLRQFDGPDALIDTNFADTPAQYRGLCCIGDKLVLGPDTSIKANVDPIAQVYDTTRKTWTSFQPSSTLDFPNGLFSLVGVPDLGEAWLLGQGAAANNAGRRIVRLKVT